MGSSQVIQTIYTQAVRFAEGGAKLVKVELPERLYAEYVEEGLNWHQMLKKLGIEVKRVRGLTEPRFFCEKEGV